MRAKCPLGLPEGSVRAVLALIVIVTVCCMALRGQAVPELLASGFGAVLMNYFMNRAKPGDPPSPPG